jgi:hypothetical protein
MNPLFHTTRRAALAGATLLAAAPATFVQAWAAKPVLIVIGAPPAAPPTST